jgi:anti-sigma factor RsiW
VKWGRSRSCRRVAATTDSCRALRGHLGTYVLAQLDDDDSRATLRAHLEECRACRAEVSELASVARALRLANPLHMLEQASFPNS